MQSTNFIYQGVKTREISFPLGGIGSGCIGLAGDGRLIDWEIFNRPNKGSSNGFSHLAIKAEHDGCVLDARVLHADLQPPYTGAFMQPLYQGFGFGPSRTTLAGMPHFKDADFQGEFPLATIHFKDETFPATVGLHAFNPFIPLNDKDSSIPGAFFEVEITNRLSHSADYTLTFAVTNPFPPGTAINTSLQDGALHRIQLASTAYEPDETGYGDLCVATDANEVSFQEYWYRGRWFDNLGVYWRELTTPGRFTNRHYDAVRGGTSESPGLEDVCTLAAHVNLNPGETRRVRFVLTWNFPNCSNYWNPPACNCGDSSCDPEASGIWRNYYATLFKDSVASADYGLQHWQRLYAETLAFKEALFASSLPPEALDAVSANISILKTPTCLRLEDGSFYGFEGCHSNCGCCEGSCAHVWNYAYALPFLFPQLERSMRDLDFRYNQGEDGGMSFRLQLPLGRERSAFRPCADGQFGGVIKAYREWKICGDTDWLQSNWTAIKKSLEFAWADTNVDGWDADRDGVLEGRQHHTLDMELFGPNAWLTGFYLAALKAGAEMAEHLGEADTAADYMALFRKGKAWVDAHLFNGEYYQQNVDLNDRTLLERFGQGASLFGDEALEAYWNAEAGELKYQIGEGCGIDQVVAQWHANLCGLGEIFDPAQTRKALEAIYRYNFKSTMRDWYNPCRLYCLNDEGGLVICAWPDGKYKPLVPVTYAEETMNGFEYQAAIHMIQEGLVKEGLNAVRAIRERYDGEKRNPWNEFECGSNYARSMASYALLLTFSGFEFDMTKGMIGFTPLVRQDDFTTFWCLHSAWGSFHSTMNALEFTLLSGQLRLERFASHLLRKNSVRAVTLDGQEIAFTVTDNVVCFEQAIELRNGETLRIDLLETF